MEHLVESHVGGFYISDQNPSVIEEYCEQCGDYDRILLSYEEGHKIEALKDYFSNVKQSLEQLEKIKSNDIDREEIIISLVWDFDDDRLLIEELSDSEIIDKKEKLLLLKQVGITQKKQFELLKSVYYPNGYERPKKLKKKSNYE